MNSGAFKKTTTLTITEPVSFEAFFLEYTFNEEAFNIIPMNGEAHSNDVDVFNGREKEVNGFESEVKDSQQLRANFNMICGM